jgi:hypothetical protein
MSKARLLVKKSTRRRYSGGSRPNGEQIASQIAPAVQTGHTGRCRLGTATPAPSATSATSSLSVVTSPPARI